MQKRLTEFELYDNLPLARDEKARGDILLIMYQSIMADGAETDRVRRKAMGVLHAECCIENTTGSRNVEQALSGQNERGARYG